MTEIEIGGQPCLLQEPAVEAIGSIALTHGAGGNRDAYILQTFANALAANGFYVARFDLPFRREGRKGPPRAAEASAARECISLVAQGLRDQFGLPVTIGGHSFGGRQASMLASVDQRFQAVLLLSYPLHPPDKPEQLRTDHFPAIHTPAFFVHGARDPFGSPEEMGAVIPLIPARTHLELAAGQGHDLRRADAPGIAELFRGWLTASAGLAGA